MLDLNHGSGCQYQQPAQNSDIGTLVNDAINSHLVAQNRKQKPRHYVSTSGIGRECMRQIQYDYLSVPKDEGRDFEGKTIRIFDRGHRNEDKVAAWLRGAGFHLLTHQPNGRQFGFEALNGRVKGHIDAAILSGPVREIAYPCLWENKALGSSSWKDVVKRGVTLSKPIYAAQIAVYQSYMNLPNPAMFTAENCDTGELWVEMVPFDAALAQRMSDKSVDVVRASDAHELLPRGACSRSARLCQGGFADDHYNFECSWIDRCWSTK